MTISRVNGGVCAPRGFTAAGVAAGIKDPAKPRVDCALVVSDCDAVVAGTFTTNRVKAAPVVWNEHVCIRGMARAIFANSGNANACTGVRGDEDVRATADRVAARLAVDPACVLVASTGVIGVPLPMDRLLAGVDEAAGALSPDGGAAAARAIMTTDTVPKELALECATGGGAVRLGAMAKGSGMIAPNMATMLAFITTDAAIAKEHLQPLLRMCVEQSFNRICVDNDMSTNDMVLCLANGRAGSGQLVPGTADYDAFAGMLRQACLELAHALVRDGEGATKFVTIVVEGAASDADALRAARAIAQSQLCKTAFAGEDPNWGRIGCAAGYSGADFDPREMDIWVGGVQVLAGGLPATYREEDAAAHMCQHDITLRVRLGGGPGECTFWTSDLSHEYVTINADYRT